MAAKTKKVILFIADGPTDEAALSPILRKLFQNEEVRFHVVHGDITSEQTITHTNAINRVNEHIKMEMARYGFQRKDILEVIHLIDTDGAFIPDSHVVKGDVEKMHYEDNQIITRNPQKTIERNERKKQVLSRLYSAKKVGGSPYMVYYFSRNLEHVLHNNSNHLEDIQKVDCADRFTDTYKDNLKGFMEFFNTSDFAVLGDYVETWNFIFEGTNSLHRHCNLHLLLKEVQPL